MSSENTENKNTHLYTQEEIDTMFNDSFLPMIQTLSIRQQGENKDMQYIGYEFSCSGRFPTEVNERDESLCLNDLLNFQCRLTPFLKGEDAPENT